MRILSSIIIVFLFLISALLPLNAQKYLDVREYNNTYEIHVYKKGSNKTAKCQAVRLNKDWFITAAHCFTPICDSSCEVKARLAETKDYALEMITEHTSSNKAAFLHSKSKEDQISYDIALLTFKPEKTTYHYKDKKNFQLLKKEDFFAKLNAPQKLEFKEAIDGVNFPTILELKTKTPKVLNRILAVASVWDGQKEILNSEDYVFYSPSNNYIYTNNFGIRQGISGSGVMTNTGELIGIVSAVAHMQRTITMNGTSQSYDIDFSMFSTFDDSVLSFLRFHIPGLNIKKAGFDYFAVVPEEYRALTENVEKM